jgi:predicted nucleic acid-binding protein
MIHGHDTGFLVAAEVTGHGEHPGARDTLARLLSAGDLIAIAPQVLTAFIHTLCDKERRGPEDHRDWVLRYGPHFRAHGREPSMGCR